jgi:hypothetical protein
MNVETAVTDVEKWLQDIACKCDKIQPHQGESCESLGRAKHKCCDDEIKNNPRPDAEGERGYDAKGNQLKETRDEMEAAGTLTGTMWPDACSVDGNGNPTQFFDFKFAGKDGCTYTDKKGVIKHAYGGGSPGADFYFSQRGKPSQFKKYQKLGKKLKPKVTKDPKPIVNAKC